MFRRRDPLDDALVELAQPDGAADLELVLAPLASPDRARYLELVEAHRLQASLANALTRDGQPVPEELDELLVDDRYVRLRIDQVLRDVSSALNGVDGLAWVVCKGPTVARLMSRAELRTYNDLDLLVAADRLEDAIDALVAIGIEELNTNWDAYLRHGVGELPMLADDITIDLHWHLIALARQRRDIKLQPRSLLERRRTILVGTQRVPALDAEDQLLHLTTHCALSGAVRLDQLRDIAVAATKDVIDWPVLLERARAAGIGRLAAQALDRTNAVLGAEIPAYRVAELGGRSVEIRRLLDGHAVTALRRFPVTTTRDAPAGTLRAVNRIAETKLRELLARPLSWNFLDEAAELFYGEATGGSDGRTRYMAMAAATTGDY